MMWAKLKQHIWEWRGVFWIAPTIAGIAIALRLMGWLQPWEWAALDQYFRWRPPEPTEARIVLIGSTATRLNDYFYTAYSGDQITTLTRTPRVEVHAYFISQILSAAVEGRPTIKSWSEVVEGLWIFLWSSVGATLCWALRDASRCFTEDVAKLLPRWTVISLFLTGVTLVGGSYLAFLVDGWWIPVVPPVLALLGSATAMTGYIANVEQRLDYTTIGDTVNRAARLESYDKLLDGGVCRILINQGTYQYVQDKFSTQQIGCVRLKGRKQGTLVYQVLDSPILKENPEGSISVSVAIALAEQRSLEKSLREDFFSTADYPFSQTEL